MEILCLGLSHQTAPVELRERDLEDLSPGARAMLREVLVVWADHRRRALLANLVTVTADRMEALERCLQEIETFHRRLRVPVSPALCMAALIAASERP
jgi:glutamyl-tRNA reductase